MTLDAKALEAEVARLIKLAGGYGYVKVHTDTLRSISSALPHAGKVSDALHNAKILITALTGPDDAIGQAAIAEIEAALSSQQAEAVPVAYRYRHSAHENWYYGPHAMNWWECQPLYASPSPADAGQPTKAVAWRYTDADINGDEWPWTLTDNEIVARRYAVVEALGVIVPATSQAKGGAGEDGPVPTYECDFSVGQPVRLANPYPEMDPSTVFYVTGISWEHRRTPAHGWNIMVASKEDIAKGYGQTDGYRPDDLLPLRSSSPVGQTAKEGGE
ncbi:MAG: hypothetical protein LCH86_09915 [Proteobacteria bacterium]|nr:hypothetical protein [Pseudomonadota bacterium]